MEFSNTTTEIGIIQEIDRICGTTNNTYSLKAKTARANAAIDRFVFLALKADKRWQFDDLNKTDLPIGTANLVSGQQDYEFADEILVVQKVLVKDSSGNWSELTPVDMKDTDGKNIWTLPSNNSGTPTKYIKFAHSILLDPIPNYDSANGFKVVFKRNAVKFVSTDTTTECGLPSIFHPYICRLAALPFLIEKNLPHKGDINALVRIDEQAIEEYFSIRNQDIVSGMRPKIENTR